MNAVLIPLSMLRKLNIHVCEETQPTLKCWLKHLCFHDRFFPALPDQGIKLTTDSTANVLTNILTH